MNEQPAAPPSPESINQPTPPPPVNVPVAQPPVVTPVAPSAPGKGTFWIGVEYFFLFISVYAIYWSVNTLLIQAVSRFLTPTTAATLKGLYDVVNKGSITTIIIFYPIFLALWIYLRKQIAQNPEIRNFKVRKVFFYITIIFSILYVLTILYGIVFGLVGGVVNQNGLIISFVQLLILAPIPAYLILEVKGDQQIR